MKDIRGYRQNDIDDIDKVRQIVRSSIAQSAFLLIIEMGSNYEKSRDALSHPSGDR